MTKAKAKDEYEVRSEQGKYLNSFKQGDNRVRILASPVMGWEAWRDTKRDDGKPGREPVRFKQSEFPTTSQMLDEGILKGDDNVASPESMPKWFWAMPIWNYGEECIQILVLKQKTIQNPIRALAQNPKWGDPKAYDIVINREGEGKESTSYTVTPDPKEELREDIATLFENANINLDALFTVDDPFVKTKPTKADLQKQADDSAEEQGIDPNDIPF